MAESHHPSQLQPVLNLLASAGFTEPDIPVGQKLTSGLVWCITALPSNVVSPEALICINNSDDLEKSIEDALKLIRCPYAIEALQIRYVDIEAVFPVVQWLVRYIQTSKQPEKPEEELSLQQVEMEIVDAKASVQSLNAELDKQEQRRINLHDKLQHARERINQGASTDLVQRLKPLVKSLKDMEKQEFDFKSDCITKRSNLEAEIRKLEEKIASESDSKILSDDLDHSLSESLESLTAVKMELGSIMRTIMSVQWQLDEMPCQSELVQYERRLSELNTHIQGKLQLTRKYYATYNALLEIKDLMLKETSLLNSMSSQFQKAITSPADRENLTDSMEGIAKGSQRKLDKVQHGLQEEQKVCDALKESYTAAMAEQRRCYSLLKSSQEDCSKK